MPLVFFTKRMDELAPEIIREVGIAVAELLRQLARRHVERAEYHIEKGKGRGEVFVESLFLCGVMPTMKHRTGEDVAQWSERPIQVGMRHGRIDEIERHQQKQRRRRESHQQDNDIRQRERQQIIERM